jgi:DNA mismatch repair protein MutL
MPIKVLPDEVASRIAAGEVIERPASVVKELLENSIDAGATDISIQVMEAGKRLIEVTDNGNGIPAAELPLAVARHATSKLRVADDLFKINTLGFRGEALASIGSVCLLTLISHQPDETIGAKFQINGGQVGKMEPVGAPKGTMVRAENLFFNVPARLKFLKNDQTERQHIDGLVMRYAMAYPEIRFRLVQDEHIHLQTTGNGKPREVLANLYSLEFARQMLEVLAPEESIEIKGFISPISLTRSNRRDITFFVNGRWVQDVPLTTALVQAYHTLLMVGRYPLAALFLQVDPEAVDVNVHPAKAEVRFRQPDRIFSGVQRAVRRSLLAYSPVPAVVSPSTWVVPGSKQGLGTIWGDRYSKDSFDAHRMNLSQGIVPENRISNLNQAAQPPLPGDRLPLLRLVGQVGATYLVAEGPDGLYLIDQHAAHERILYEKFMAKGDKPPGSQILLEPVTINFSTLSAKTIFENLPLLARFGFQVESFGPTTFLIRAVPSFINAPNPATLISVLVDDFEEDESSLQNETESRLIARICKRAAVKGGKPLSVEEQSALLRDLENCSSPRTCPHGRPTMIHLSADLLERQFGRRGAR